MKKMINYAKRDFRSVSEALMFITNGRMPKWARAIWYIVMLPIGLILTPFALAVRIVNRVRWHRYLKRYLWGESK